MYLTVWQPLLECIFRQIYLHITSWSLVRLSIGALQTTTLFFWSSVRCLYLVPGNVMTHEVKDNIPIIISIFLINSD